MSYNKKCPCACTIGACGNGGVAHGGIPIELTAQQKIRLDLVRKLVDDGHFPGQAEFQKIDNLSNFVINGIQV